MIMISTPGTSLLVITMHQAIEFALANQVLLSYTVEQSKQVSRRGRGGYAANPHLRFNEVQIATSRAESYRSTEPIAASRGMVRMRTHPTANNLNANAKKAAIARP